MPVVEIKKNIEIGVFFKAVNCNKVEMSLK